MESLAALEIQSGTAPQHGTLADLIGASWFKVDKSLVGGIAASGVMANRARAERNWVSQGLGQMRIKAGPCG